MDLKQCFILRSFCIAVLVSISSSEHFEVSSPPTVIGTVGQDVILPCQISLGRQPQSMEVQWQKIGNDYVSIYQFKAASLLETFGHGYESRTVLAKEGLPNGNVSLKLKNVQVTDEGSYRCIVKSTSWSDNTKTALCVTGMGMVSIEILGPEGKGIKLACRSSGWFPRPELQWLIIDNQSHPFELEQDHEQLFSVFSSITVLRGTREVTCLVQEKGHLQMKQKATISLSRDIFPQTSPWLPAFWVLFMLSFLVFGVTGFYINKGKQKYYLKKRSEEEERLFHESQMNTLKGENSSMRDKLERIQAELDFRKAQSYLVRVHLDPSCKHPELAVSADFSEVQYKPTSSEAATTAGALIAVAKEGFGGGRQYWQVWVRDKMEWELGVLTEATRDMLEKQKFEAPQEEGYWSLRMLNGRYHSEEAGDQIGSRFLKPQMVGVYLDWEEHIMSFYSVNSMTAIMKIPIETSEKLYPFFSPGHSELGDKEKPLIIYHNRDWDFPTQLG
ncbi:UNVERIFIED_CONTAM: hypothetical protein K2H54_030689 [Gekko kuhli]